jgi:hypothetical protein
MCARFYFNGQCDSGGNMVSRYKPRNRDKLIEQANRTFISCLIKSDMTATQKRDMIAEKNPWLYIFGERLLPMSVDYHDHENKLYLGECDVDV